jgi:hypothetical protein
MNLIRTEFREDGIFGHLLDDKGQSIAMTLEHAYQQPDGSWAPKIYDGQFICVRGPHRLNGMTADFETFEITGVKGHEGLLFHAGNFDKDSSGCILLGEDIVTQADGSEMVTNSRATFAKFMNGLDGVTEFLLTVS